ncbi:RNA methyltransferase [Prosthecochloris sp. HL-130-GSB]|jgi:RNA methyltransferase, TrmH family|uniref:TrmH family RNA methyltransferase n=1 Tax=Prosthecochloris sp. HL-130-GSB TaxID=1974213 RepID=UPI000A1C190E|nr:RNA methyltransferase [Prosthecochloris sp. HL-130-GSB]ARM31510.1 rRNA methyltransferase [Prosthecochloris sp. HL-130-GSB]MBO8092809.1 RNA methyltransferase [Prosthecochloris sp.]
MSPRQYSPAGRGMIRRYARLHRKKFRDRERCFLAEGLRTVNELLSSMPSDDMLVALFVVPGLAAELAHAERYRDRVCLVTADEGRQLAGTSTAQGVTAVFRYADEFPGPTPVAARSLVIALDAVQDPGNAGTILRTAAWFGASALLSGKGSVDLYNPKCVRSSAGSLYAVSHRAVLCLSDALQELKQDGYHVVTASLDGASICDIDVWPERVVLVIGNEANGVSSGVEEIADMRVRIPHAPGHQAVESLNAAVSAGILMSGIVSCR